ncbi:Cationic amino acid transporter 7 [Ranunculus cassubicifolius]
MEESHGSSFSSIRAYGRALAQTATRLTKRAGSVSTTFEEMSHIRDRSGSDMQKSLRWYDLVGFGIGGMVGAGVFVTTGRASRLYAGPAVVLSYAIAGVCALLSAFCYTEFAVDMPVAGGAFSYLRITFGEFAAFITGANLVMEYVFSNAAVARSFTAYLGTAMGVSATEKWRITISGLPEGFNEIDLIAVGVILVISLCICYSTKESSMLNMVLTVIHVLFIAFIIVIGFWKGDWKNFKEPENPKKPDGFLPYGISGVFNGAAMVYLSYIGYDAVSTMAEEVKNPAKDIPIGVSGSVVLVTIIYSLMAASMSKLVPYDAIDTEAPFSSAFRGSDGWGWVSNVIGGGASFGILTSLLVSMLGQARYVCVIGRSGVIPTWFAKVHPKTSTPVNASAFLGIFTAAIALFTDLNVLLNLVSIGTLFVFYMVANAVIHRRYVHVAGKPKAFTLGACSVVAIGLLQVFHIMVPQAQKPQHWGVPLMPWLPSISIFLNVFLLGSLDGPSYIRFGFFSGLAVLVYVLYSVHTSFDAQGEGSYVEADDQIVKHIEPKVDDAYLFSV